MKHISWLNLGLWTVKCGKLKMDSFFFIFFNFLYEEATTAGILFKIGVLKNFTKLTEKQLCRSILFLIKLWAWQLQRCERRDSETGVFLLILGNFCEHLRLTAAIYGRIINCLYSRGSCKYDSRVKRKTLAD